ncbi:MAG: hypothetical protein ACD_23C00970G0001, partial [uncultured bacterium]
MHDLVQRQVEQVGTLSRLHQHLGDIAVNLLHGFEIHAVTRNLGSLLVLRQNRRKPLCIALRLRDDTCLIRGRLFLQPGRGTDRTGNDIIGIGLRFIFCPLPFLPGLQHIVKRRLHLLRWTHAPLLQIDADHLHPDLVTVENRLHECAHPRRNLVTFLGQRSVHAHLANHFAYGSFCSLHHGICRILAFEKPGPGVAQSVLDGKLDFDNIFVFGQHGRFAQPRALDHIVPPYVGRSNLGHKDQFVAFDRIGKTPIETRPLGALVLAETRNDCLLAFLNNENAGSHPDHKHNPSDESNAHARALHVWLKTTAIAATGTTR